MHCHLFQMFDGIGIPTAESLNNEWDEGNSLSATVIEMGAVLCGLAHLDGGCWKLGGAMDNGILRGGNDADVEGQLLAVDP